MNRRIILALSAGATLSLPACGSRSSPGPAEVAPSTVPVVPAPVRVEPGLKTWSQVVDVHDLEPPTTNPPSPSLVVGTDARCFVAWTDARREDPPPVQVCRPSCGTEIVCPEAAAGLLETWRNRPLPTWDATKISTKNVRPVLVVDPAGLCFKQWFDTKVPETPMNTDRVQLCNDPRACGTEVQCPERSAALLEGWTGEP